MKNIRTIAFLVLGFCAYAAPILAAVDCQCYASNGCGPTPPNCNKTPLQISPECKQFCNTLCNTPPNPNTDPPKYVGGCCSYVKTTYQYTSSGGTCIDPGNCTDVTSVTYSASKSCYSNGFQADCLQVRYAGACE